MRMAYRNNVIGTSQYCCCRYSVIKQAHRAGFCQSAALFKLPSPIFLFLSLPSPSPPFPFLFHHFPFSPSLPPAAKRPLKTSWVTWGNAVACRSSPRDTGRCDFSKSTRPTFMKCSASLALCQISLLRIERPKFKVQGQTAVLKIFNRNSSAAV